MMDNFQFFAKSKSEYDFMDEDFRNNSHIFDEVHSEHNDDLSVEGEGSHKDHAQ